MGHYYFTHTASPTLLSSKTCCVAPRGWPETRRRVHVRDHDRALSALGALVGIHRHWSPGAESRHVSAGTTSRSRVGPDRARSGLALKLA